MDGRKMYALKGLGMVQVVAAGILMFLVVASKAQETCENDVNCILPDCFCPKQTARSVPITPGNLDPVDIPQIVVFGFDDAVNTQNIDIYNRLFPSTLKNPNGCPVSMSLFVSHNFTDYSMVRSLYDRGMEIAAHSVTHRTPTLFWKTISKEDMLFEAGQSRRLISALAGIPLQNITGWRSPFLQLGGDMSFEVLTELGYQYDASILVSGTSGQASQQWPFSLDYGFHLRCQVPPCPRNPVPGFWEIPVVPLADMNDRFPCTYLDSCFSPPMTKEETLDILLKNFVRNYNNNREPLYINLHSSFFFQAEYRLEAVEEFMETALTLCNTYFVSHQQLLEWVRRPTNIDDVMTFEPWLCANNSAGMR